ncbi:aminodeoxychorismate lyase [Corynebacterium glucuronolyticum]|uniref:aminodeoxychorismate lyase n=1 Tax=Corynebacterium glucuronolyticum TaxID=39791 RepID=UPI00019C21DA|nr:aminodeoxychorismate lyase [Corynebacterium glucuronolyticum]EEI25944.1 aminotransferase, class IV [Corynebacterium glucuronolyticum ATCC 51867]QRO82598.1 aminodeoxychorismate lyase [Corynebacterium glucuronolyticum]
MGHAPVIVVVEPFGGSSRRQSPQLPHIFWDDLGLTRADGIFESLLVHEGRACNVERHVDRFLAGAKKLQLPELGRDLVLKATAEAVEGWVEQCGEESVDGKLVWTFTRGRASTGIPSVWMTVTDVPEGNAKLREKGVKVKLCEKGITLHPEKAPWIASGAKSLGYSATMAALRAAKAEGMDDVIWVDGDRILEGATSTVISIKGKKVRTPPSGTDVLSGTTQQAVFETLSQAGYACKEKALSVDKLKEADGVWLVSSVRGAVPVRSIDGHKLRRDTPDDIARLLAEAMFS